MLISLQSEYRGSVFVHEFKDASTATSHAGHWVIRDHDGQSGFFHE